jgi:hypothetical protein
VEIPKGSRNKYEYDADLGLMVFDRFLSASVVFPTDYGFIRGAYSADGDPMDVLITVSEPTFPGCAVHAKESELNNLFHTGHDSVVPVTMEKVPSERYRFFLLIGEFDFCGVEVGVKFATDGQSCGRCGVGDEVDDRLVSFEWPSAPVLGDSREEPVFDFVPFAGTGRVMGDDDV